MDKEYLIHNIKLEDNPEDQHQTIDIKLDNIRYDNDWIANVGLDGYVNGYPVMTDYNEDVSLTGAGGGGGGVGVPLIPFTLKWSKHPNALIGTAEVKLTTGNVTYDPDSEMYYMEMINYEQPDSIVKEITGKIVPEIVTNDVLVPEVYFVVQLISTYYGVQPEYSDFINCTADGDGYIYITDISQPAGVTAYWSEGDH